MAGTLNAFPAMTGLTFLSVAAGNHARGLF